MLVEAQTLSGLEVGMRLETTRESCRRPCVTVDPLPGVSFILFIKSIRSMTQRYARILYYTLNREILQKDERNHIPYPQRRDN